MRSKKFVKTITYIYSYSVENGKAYTPVYLHQGVNDSERPT